MENFEEYVRRCLRWLLKPSTYFMVANIYNEIYMFFCLGPTTYGQMRKIRAFEAGSFKAYVSIESKYLTYPFYIRLGTTDFGEFCHTIIRRAYRRSIPLYPVKMIIDAGAYIGDTACWYATQCPEATIVALEPDPSNFGALKRNAVPYGNRIEVVRSALWHEDRPLKISNGSGSSGMTVRELHAGETSDCMGVSPRTLIDQLSPGGVDIVKLDVEGEELNLFRPKFDNWIEKVHTIVVDLHSKEAAEMVLQAAVRWGRECERYRELYILRKMGL